MKLSSYQKRIGEIDSEIAELEAKKALQKGSSKFGFIKNFSKIAFGGDVE